MRIKEIFKFWVKRLQRELKPRTLSPWLHARVGWERVSTFCYWWAKRVRASGTNGTMLVSSRGPANIHQSEHQLQGQKSFWFLFGELKVSGTFVVFFQCQLLQFLMPLIRDNIREICTTVYALPCMEIKFPSRHDEWELVARKAEAHSLIKSI